MPEWGHRLVSRLARMRLVRRLAGRDPLPPTEQWSRGHLVVPGGHHLPAEHRDLVPVTMIVRLDATEASLEALVDGVAREQLVTAGFRPLFVTDCDAFMVFRRHGYLFEFVPPKSDWEAIAGLAANWETFVEQRLRSLVETYRPATILVVREPIDPEHGAFGAVLRGAAVPA